MGAAARFISGRTKYQCYVCNLAGGEKDGHMFKKCVHFGCNAVYCKDCYEELHRYILFNHTYYICSFYLFFSILVNLVQYSVPLRAVTRVTGTTFTQVRNFAYCLNAHPK